MQDAPHREVELKLRVQPGELARLRDSDVVRSHARAVTRVASLTSTYYDTPDHRLASRGVALRIRRDGQHLIQTLKAANGGARGAAHDRAEWEVELTAPRPDLAAFGDPEVLEATGLVLPDELQPFFETKVRRHVALVEWPDGRHGPALVEVAFDEGTIEADGRSQDLAEVELELKEGRPESLFTLAEALRGVAPLALETVDKSARGYRLATRRAPLPRKAGALELPPSPTVEGALAAVLRHGLGHWLANEAAARDGSAPEGVHQLRVALRRLRSALGIFREVLAPAARERWGGEMRWLLRELGPARDLDVLLTELLPPALERPELRPLAAALEGPARARRDAAYGAVRAALDGRRYADLALGFAAWVERGAWREGVDVDLLLAQRGALKPFAATTLRRRYRQVRKRGRGFAGLSPEARHEVRIALKKLRYGTEYFGSLHDAKRVKPFARRLAALQDQLGHLNDVAVAHRLVTDLVRGLPEGTPEREAAALGAGALIGWQAAAAGEALPAATLGWEDFRDAEPFWGEAA